MIRISIIFLSILGLSVSQDLTGCILQYNVKLQPTNTYGSLNVFYNIAKGIADGLQKPLSDKALQDLYNLFNNQTLSGITTHEVVNEILKNQAPSIVFACIGLFIILISLIIGFVYCCIRCVKSSKTASKTNVKPTSRCGVAFILFLVTTCFAFILTSVIIFNQSATNLFHSVEQSNVNIAYVVRNLSDTLNTGSESMECAMQQTVDYTFGQINAQATAFSNNLGEAFIQSCGIVDIQNQIASLIVMLNDADTQTHVIAKTADNITTNPDVSPTCSQELTTFSQRMDVTSHLLLSDWTIMTTAQTQMNSSSSQITGSLNNLEGLTNGTLKSLINNLSTVESDINSAINTINTIVQQTMDVVVHLENAIDDARNDIITDSAWGAIKASVRAVATTPTVVALFFSLFAMIVLTFYLIKPTDHPANRAAGYVFIFGGYFVIFLTWVIMGTAVVSFIGGWAIAGACQPLFEDSNFRLYSLVNSLSFQLTALNGSLVSVTARDILYKCAENKTVFDAVNGNEVINADMVNNMINWNSYEGLVLNEISNSDVSFSISTILDTEVQSSTTKTVDDYNTYNGAYYPSCDPQLGEIIRLNNLVQQFLKLYKQIVDNMQQLVLTLNNFTGQGTVQGKQGMTNYTLAEFNQAQLNINTSVSYLLTNLNTNIFPGEYLYFNFENGGSIMCDITGKPVHGLWASAGLAALFFIPLAILLFCASSTLFARRNFRDYDKTKDEKRMKKDRSKEKEKRKRKKSEDSSETTVSEGSDELFARPTINILTNSPFADDDYTRKYRSPYVDDAFKNSTRVLPAIEPETYSSRTIYRPYLEPMEPMNLDKPVGLRRETVTSPATYTQGMSSLALRRPVDLEPWNQTTTSRGLRRIDEDSYSAKTGRTALQRF